MKKQISKPLGQRGFSHILAPILVVVLVAIGGVYLLVSSHADANTRVVSASTKKQHAKIAIKLATVTGSSTHIIAELRNSKGAPVPESKCHGSADIAVTDKAKFTVSTPGIGATWSGGVCKFSMDVDGLHSKSGSAKGLIIYSGSADYYSVHKKFGVARHKVSNDVTSGGNSLGG